MPGNVDAKQPRPSLMKMKFSLPFPVAGTVHNSLRTETFIERLREFSPWIHCINVTTRIPPFDTDAHGVYMDSELSKRHMDDALFLQEMTGVEMSALFNNIHVPPTLENLELLVEGLKPLYERGLRSITQPHTIWMAYGILQREFPEMFIKNTVIRRTRSALDFWTFARSGFDYVNLDRLLARDIPELQQIKKAQEKFHKTQGKYVYTSMLLGTESCMGVCAFWEEDFQHATLHPDIRDPEKNPFAVNSISNMSCRTAPRFYPSRIGISPYAEDLAELCSYFDVIKIGGRRVERKNVEDIFGHIEEFIPVARGEKDKFSNRFHPMLGPLFDAFEKNRKPLLGEWRKKIRTCRFNCWDCDLCYHMAVKAMEDDIIEGEALHF